MQNITSLFNRYYRTAFGIICLMLIFVYSKRFGYILFHTLVELFSIVIAFAVFIVAWNSRKMQDNKYLHVVGISYLFIGALDLLHTLSYKGMNIIPLPGYPANQFWVATRGMEAMIFLGGFLMIGRKRKVNTELIFLLYFVVSSLIAASILVWKIFPLCFVPGVGQTLFKVVCEYIIILLLLGSLFLLYRGRANFDQKTYQLLSGSIIAAILSECCFATYTSNYGPLNEWGHYGKLISFFLIYKANVQMAFEKPMASIFRELKASETEYKALAENLPDVIMRFDENLDCIYINRDISKIPQFADSDVQSLSKRIWNELKQALSTRKSIAGELEVNMQQSHYYSFQIIPEIFDNASEIRLLVIFRDITIVRKEKLHLSKLLDTLPQQVWTAKADGTIDYVNGVIIRDFALDTDSRFGIGWQHYVHPDDLQECTRVWMLSLSKGTEYQVQFRLKMADGQYLWHLGRAVPILENGEVILWIGSNTNIDLQKKGQEQRDEFISIASHELKTPLTSIKAFNQLLARTNDLERAKSYLQKVDVATTKLESLINDLLDVSKINAGKLQFNKTTFNLDQLIQECCENLQLSVNTHRIIWSGTEQINVCADRFRMEQVIDNLLSNAVKYSPNADVVNVTFKVEQESIIIAVEDHGIGIDSRELEKLFDRYYRSDNAAERFGGLGLGLFISSEIIKAHQGTFWIESELGVGTTVYIRVPLKETVVIKDPVTKGQNYSNEYLTISCNDQQGWMEANWTGHHNFKSVQNGGLKMVELLRSSGLKKVLNDNREVLGNWSEASDWAGKVWFPMMTGAGLQNFAWILSPSIFAQLAAQKSFDVSDGKANVRFFYDIEEAKRWLREN
ncbi:MASE3 domain-containing protein [Pedobacter sp. KLB.chiD]|uniref:MASE3 domain-containing protein n=1 Tax=Pedobacter sp. KLB.chiD TaxID=3387402 RepID=UPI00399AB572